LYLVVLGLVCHILFVGLDFYSGFVLEHRFGLSNETVWDWAKKNTKKFGLSLLLLLVTGEGLYFFLRHFPRYWWLAATAGWFLLTVALGRVAPVLIVPLFYKCIPLAKPELRQRLLRLGGKCGVPIKEVFEIHLSTETKKANAAVVGLGKSKRILLGDTLLADYLDEEIEAIFAHELGHIRLLHSRKILAFGAVISLLCFYLTSLLFRAAADRLGFADLHDITAFPLLALILMTAGLILLPLQMWFARILERRADIFAVEHTENAEYLAAAMEKLARQNLVDPSPSRLQVMVLHDHPPISKRLDYIRAAKNEQA